MLQLALCQHATIAKECPAPVPITFCLLTVRFGMGFGSCTLSTVPSPHMPWSFQPHDTATPSAAPGKGVDGQRMERRKERERERERGRGNRVTREGSQSLSRACTAFTHLDRQHAAYISHTALLVLSSIVKCTMQASLLMTVRSD